jgi:hypothetical protein
MLDRLINSVLKYEGDTSSVGIKNVSIWNWGNCRAQCIRIRGFIDNDKRPFTKTITTALCKQFARP